ncbi:hypothetical protein PN36_25690 [Candidatus Thiomargarita nelsonii]|uniref:Uncharacterized protein n=1 Tax=Candidatus Thiomargarita nelsonii TaxID=1003181 RepID=A0A0A6PHY4_9GAMM|nr:hypothetical protein PN36_25690 [Candidatus Thiomargarita nelsonii]
MLAVKGIYQKGQLFLQERVPLAISSSVGNNPLLGLFANEAELIDEINESAMQARENDPLRYSDG